MSDIGLILKNIEIKKGNEKLLNIDVQIKRGEVLTLMGASGSGKSSLINAICGFLSPVFSCTGNVILNGRDITKTPSQEKNIGVLFQDALLFNHFNVEQNIMFALKQKLSIKSLKSRREKAYELLDMVNMADFAKRDVFTLSGGQQARVALVRVLAYEPECLLLDEPFSKLDEKLRNNVREIVFSISEEKKLPTLLVTHDKEDAKAAGGAIISL